MGSRAAQQALVPGRLVLVTDSRSRLPELAMICGSAPAASGRGLLQTSSTTGAVVSEIKCTTMTMDLSIDHPFLAVADDVRSRLDVLLPWSFLTTAACPD